MKEQDKKLFQDKMTSVALIYGVDASKELLRAYFDVLNKYDIESVINGFDSHILDSNRGRFMPKPCDITFSIEESKKSKEDVDWGKVYGLTGWDQNAR